MPLAPCDVCGADCRGYGCHSDEIDQEHGPGCMKRVIADNAASATDRAELEAALRGLGRPFRGGPNLCWCPESWSGPANHTDACLRAFAALVATDRPAAAPDDRREGSR